MDPELQTLIRNVASRYVVRPVQSIDDLESEGYERFLIIQKKFKSLPPNVIHWIFVKAMKNRFSVLRRNEALRQSHVRRDDPTLADSHDPRQADSQAELDELAGALSRLPESALETVRALCREQRVRPKKKTETKRRVIEAVRP